MSSKKSIKKKNKAKLRNILLAILPGLIVAGLIFAANIYYDLDAGKIIVDEYQKVINNILEATSGFIVSGGATQISGSAVTINPSGAINITASSPSLWQVSGADLTIKTNTSGNLIIESAEALTQRFATSSTYTLYQGTTARLAIDTSGNISATGNTITLAGPTTISGNTTTTGNVVIDGDLSFVGPQEIKGTGTLKINPTGNLYLQIDTAYVDDSGNIILPSGTRVEVPELRFAGDITINASSTGLTTVIVQNPNDTQVANLRIEGDIDIQGGKITLATGETIEATSTNKVLITSDGTMVVKIGANEILVVDSNGIVVSGTATTTGDLIVQGESKLATTTLSKKLTVTSGGIEVQSGGADITGTVAVTGQLSSTATTTLATSQGFVGIATSTPYGDERLTVYGGIYGSGNVVLAGTATSSLAGPIQIMTDKLVVDSSGKVGIGTATPSKKLHVEGECVTGDTLLPILENDQNKKAGSENPASVAFGKHRGNWAPESQFHYSRPRDLVKSFDSENLKRPQWTGQDSNLQPSGAHLNALPIKPPAQTGTADSLYQNYQIKYIPIKDIKGGEYVLSLNEETGKIEPARIKGLLDKGVQPIYKIETEDGRTIRTTGNHPYLTKNGWIKVSQLEEGIEIAVPKLTFIDGTSVPHSFDKNSAVFNREFGPPVFSNSESEFSFMISPQFFSEGHGIRGRSVESQFSNNFFSNVFRQFFQIFLGSLSNREFEGHKNYLSASLSSIFSPEITRPFLISSSALRRDFLNGGLNVSMSSTVSSNSIFSSGDIFQPEASAIVTNFSSFSNSQTGSSGLESPSRKDWGSQTIFSSLRRFLSKLINPSSTAFLGSGERSTEGSDKIFSKDKVLSIQDYDNNSAIDVKWDKIASIEYVGYEQVYDIEVEETHNFLAGHFINSKTGQALTPEEEAKYLRLINSKFQISNNKQIQNSNDQNSKQFGISNLEFGNCLEFGACDLVLDNKDIIFGGIVAHNTYISATTTLAGAGGFVGIATTTPYGTETLTVYGNIYGSGNIILAGTATSSLAGPIQIMTDKFVVDPSGKVGIGTTAPAQKLDVAGYVQAQRFIDRDNTSYYLDPASTDNSLLVAGNVGIGTAKPKYTFDVTGQGRFFGTVTTPPLTVIQTETTGKLAQFKAHLPGVANLSIGTSLNELTTVLTPKSALEFQFKSSVAWIRKSSWDTPDVGSYAVPAFADLDNDGDYDLMIGERYGGNYAYENTGSTTNPVWTRKSSWDVPDVGNWSAPAFADLDNDGDYDLMIGEYSGISFAYENTGSATNPVWTRKSSWDAPDVGYSSAPAFADLDNDGDYDLMIGEDLGVSFAYENTGSTTNPVWTRKSSWDAPGVESYSAPAFADLDNDGDYDLMIGERYGRNYAYENTGSTTNPVWTRKSSWDAPDVGNWSAPAFADLDNDGDYDLMIGEQSGRSFAYENTGQDTSVVFKKGGEMTSFGNITLTGGKITLLALSSPAKPSLATTTGGSCATSTTYYYRVTAVNPNGQTLGSPEASINTGADGQTVNVSWSAVEGATGYKVYRNTSSISDGASVSLVDDKVITNLSVADDCSGDGTAKIPTKNNTGGAASFASGNLTIDESGNLAVGGSATTTGSLAVQGSTTLATTTVSNLLSPTNVAAFTITGNITGSGSPDISGIGTFSGTNLSVSTATTTELIVTATSTLGTVISGTWQAGSIDATGNIVASGYLKAGAEGLQLTATSTVPSVDLAAGRIYYDSSAGVIKYYTTTWRDVGLWQSTSTYTYLYSTTSDIVIGASTTSSAPFWMDVDSGLTLNVSSTAAVLSVIQSSTGEIVDFKNSAGSIFTLASADQLKLRDGLIQTWGGFNKKVIDDFEDGIDWSSSDSTNTSISATTTKAKVNDYSMLIKTTVDNSVGDKATTSIANEDWTGYDTLAFWIRADYTTTSTDATTTQIISVLFHNSAPSTTSEEAITIREMGEYQYQEWDISGIANATSVDWFGFRIDNDYGSPEFYIDQIRLYGHPERTSEIFVDKNGSLNLLGQQSVEITRTKPGGSLPGIKVSTGNIVLNQPLEVAVAGDVGIDYDLYFANPGLSQITSEGPLKISAGDANSYEDLTLTTGGTGDVIIDIADSVVGLKILAKDDAQYTFSPEGTITIENKLAELTSSEHGLYQNFAQIIVDYAAYATDTASSTYREVTAEINSCGGTAQTLLADTEDTFYWGFASKTYAKQLFFDLDTVATTSLNLIFRYSTSSDSTYANNDSWPILSTTSDTVAGFTQDGKITWDPPSDWGASDLGDPAGLGDIGNYYWIRVDTDTTGWTQAPTAFYGTPSVMCSDFIRSRQANANKFRVSYEGKIYAADTTVQKVDVAEIYPSAEALEPGDVVCFDPLRPGYVQVCGAPSSANLAGVVSTKPGLTLGGSIEGNSIGYPIALVGRVPVKVSLEAGPIKIGDPLTSASLPGVAMRATKAGKILGYALENYNPPTPDVSQTTSGVETLGEKWSEIETTEQLVAASPASTTIATSTIEEIERAQREIEAHALNTPLTTSTEETTTSSETAENSSLPTEDIIPLESSASSHFAVGKILAFVNLTYFSGALTIQEQNGQLTDTQPLQPAQVPQYFAIDNNGYLIVQKLKAKEIEVEKLSVGIPANASSTATSTLTNGITIYDRATGQPYCLFIENGALQTTPGKCGTSKLTPDIEKETSGVGAPSTESGTEPTCDSSHLDLCQIKEECENASGYWYNDICNPQPKDTDGDGIFDSEDACLEIAGDFCRGCPLPECTGCQKPVCPETGQPICQDDNSLCQAENATGICQNGTCQFTCKEGYQKDENDVCQLLP